MSRVLLNIDLGERGTDHPVDLRLLDHADLANLACGGHAGSADGVRFWAREASVRGVGLTAHLSYPDRSGFGRRPMDPPFADLAAALARQRELLPDTDTAKLHGALYHAADTDTGLADPLTAWLGDHGFDRVLTPGDGALASAARSAGLLVLAEAFADRRYTREHATGRAVLLGRDQPGAVLCTEAAVAQTAHLVEHGTVTLHPHGETATVPADTLCVHGDHADSVQTAAAVSALLRGASP